MGKKLQAWRYYSVVSLGAYVHASLIVFECEYFPGKDMGTFC